MNTLLVVVPKVLMNIGVSLLSEKLVEELFWWLFKKIADHTKTKIDNEIYQIAYRQRQKKNG